MNYLQYAGKWFGGSFPHPMVEAETQRKLNTLRARGKQVSVTSRSMSSTGTWKLSLSVDGEIMSWWWNGGWRKS